MQFNEKVRMLANERKMSQADFARTTGMSTAQVNHLFSGRTKNPRLKTLIATAHAFSIDMNTLMEDVTFEDA